MSLIILLFPLVVLLDEIIFQSNFCIFVDRACKAFDSFSKSTRKREHCSLGLILSFQIREERRVWYLSCPILTKSASA